MDTLTVALDLHCYECGRDVHLEYEPPTAAPGGVRPVNARFWCPHCRHQNEIDLPGRIIVTRKPAGPVALGEAGGASPQPHAEAD